MGFTSDAHGKPHWRGTKCVSRSRQGQALEPGSLRLTWSASRKHRCQVEPPPAGSLRSGSSQVILNVLRKPEPLPPAPSLHSSRPAKAGHARRQLGSSGAVAANSFCLFLRPETVVLERAKLGMLHLAGRYGERGGLSFDPMHSRGRGWEEQQTEP